MDKRIEIQDEYGNTRGYLEPKPSGDGCCAIGLLTIVVGGLGIIFWMAILSMLLGESGAGGFFEAVLMIVGIAVDMVIHVKKLRGRKEGSFLQIWLELIASITFIPSTIFTLVVVLLFGEKIFPLILERWLTFFFLSLLPGGIAASKLSKKKK